MKWKKYLIFLITFLTSFLVIDEIHAQTTIPITTYSNSYYYYDEWLALRENDGYTTYHNEIFDYKNIDSNTGNVNFERLFNYGILENDTNYIFYKSESYNPNASQRNNWTGWFVVSKNNVNYFYMDSFLKNSTTMGIRVIISTQEIIIDKTTNLPILTDNSTSGFWKQQDNYFDYYNDNDYKNAWNTNRIRQNYFTNYNVMYSDNTIFAENNSFTAPNISITYSDFNFNVSFDIIDNSKYVYAYRLGNNSNWTTYTFGYDQNSFNVPVASNDTLYVEVIDSETLEVVRSATYSLSTLTPTITITPTESTDNYVSLRITFGVIDYDSYDYYLKSATDSVWTYLYSTDSSDNNFDITFTENNTLYVRIVDKSDESNIVAAATYTITTITEESTFFDSDETNFHGLSSIISFPIRFIRRIVSSTCTPLNLPIPYTGETIQLPCFYSIYQSIGNGALLSIYQLITDGVISYYVILNFLSLIKNMRDPDNDKIEVFEL